MTQIAAIGQTATTVLANLRQGAASTSAPVARKLAAKTPVPVYAQVAGQSVQGNADWYLTDGQCYVWAGACAPLQAASGAAPPTGASATVPLVVDLYHGDNVASFGQAYAAGLRGVIHKATTGQSGTDPLYAQRRLQAEKAGLLWGAYHWGTAAPAALQVDNFLRTAKPGPNTLVALDFEPDEGNQMSLDGAREFLQAVEVKLGRRAVLYSGSLIKSALGKTNDAFFGQHRLWLAQYGNQPTVQASWPTYWLWQYTDGSSAGPGPKSVPGLPGNGQGQLDCNHFQGDEAQLLAQWAS